jgi:hypothetical protein
MLDARGRRGRRVLFLLLLLVRTFSLFLTLPEGRRRGHATWAHRFGFLHLLLRLFLFPFSVLCLRVGILARLDRGRGI